MSTDKSRQELGVEAQRHAIESWAEREGVTIALWLEEEVSGGADLADRPTLLEAIASTAALGAGWLVVHRLDRFARDPLAALLAEAELQRNGASIAVAEGAGGGGTDPTAELVRGMLLVVARFEKRMIQARIKAALGVKKRRGELVGECPFGLRVGADGKTLEPEPAEQAVITQVLALREHGLSERQVVAHLRAREVVSPRSGVPLGQPQVHRILARARASARREGRAA